MRYYRLAKTFGWTPTQVDSEPAELLDWLLRIDDEIERIKAEEIETAQGDRAQRQAQRR